MTDLTRLTAGGLAIASGETSAVEVAQAHLDRIAAVDPAVDAFLPQRSTDAVYACPGSLLSSKV
jgi:aspartyl-tRNA(Asn)/glutamyl-tRNA(Gln) amidotransferase subunit A